MNQQALTSRAETGLTLAQFLAGTPELGFQPRLLGTSQAPVFPQRVGKWWLEPLTPQTILPRRAADRLAAVLASGVQLRAVVVFHEIAGTRATTRSDAALAALDSLLGQFRESAPVFGHAAARAASFVRQKATQLANAVQASDPCLVVVTQDGEWIELDRWYS